MGRLVTVAALPEASLVGGGGCSISSIGMLASMGSALVSSCWAAGEENNEGREEEEDHGSKNGPHADEVLGRASALVIVFIVDVVLQDSEENKIRGHDYKSENPGKTSEQRSEKATANTCSKC